MAKNSFGHNLELLIIDLCYRDKGANENKVLTNQI